MGQSILYSKPISGGSSDGRKVSPHSTHGRRYVVAKRGTGFECSGCLLPHVSWAVTWRPFSAAAREALHLNRCREYERPLNSVESERAPWTRCPVGRHRRPDPCLKSAPPTRPRTFVESSVGAADHNPVQGRRRRPDRGPPLGTAEKTVGAADPAEQIVWVRVSWHTSWVPFRPSFEAKMIAAQWALNGRTAGTQCMPHGLASLRFQRKTICGGRSMGASNGVAAQWAPNGRLMGTSWMHLRPFDFG